MAVNRSTRDVLSIVAAVIALLIVVIVNQLADRSFRRVDLTADERYSLSEGFLNVINRLESTLRITYVVSGQVPPGLERIKRDILDKLNDIKTAGKGKIVLDVIDPTNNPELIKELDKEGAGAEVTVTEKDKQISQFLYSRLSLTYLDRPTEKLVRVFNAEMLEYMIASKVLTMTLDKGALPIVAFCLPPPDMQAQMPMRQRPQGPYDWMTDARLYEKRFDVRLTQINESSPIPDKTKLLIIVRPKEFNERQKYEVSKYLAEGGKVLLVTNPIKLNLQFMTWEKNLTGLEPFFDDWGLTIKDQMVCDDECVKLGVLRDMEKGVEYHSYPVFVKISPQKVNQNSIITRRLPSLTMPFATEIVLDEKKLGAVNLKSEILAKTSDQAWSFKVPEGILVLEPLMVPPAKREGAKNTFIKLAGQFPFPYEQRVVPDWPAAEVPGEKKEPKKEGEQKVGKANKAAGMLLVWSAPESFSEFYLRMQEVGREFQGNMISIPNIMETCALGDDLIKIRAKSYDTRTIERFDNDATKRNLIKIALSVGVPLLALIFWLVRWSMRRRAQLAYERVFAQTSGPSSFSP